MATASPPIIFSDARRLAIRRRMLAAQERPDAPRYLLDEMVEDVIERLGFLRIAPRQALVIGDWTGALAAALREQGTQVTAAEPSEGFDEQAPFPTGGFDFIASLGTLDTVNDLPGALIHLRNALAPGGLMIASFPGAGSLPELRTALMVADGERPSARIHPQVDVRAGGQLLQRAGFADPVVDSRGLDVAFRSLGRLVADLRAMGLSSALASPGAPVGKQGVARAEAAFAAAGAAGRTVERFEILTLSGWKR